MLQKQKDIADLSFEEGMVELEGLVNRLEGRDIGLEESLAAFERGHALQQHLSATLKAAELRIEKITAQADAPASKTPATKTPTSKISAQASTDDDELPF